MVLQYDNPSPYRERDRERREAHLVSGGPEVNNVNVIFSLVQQFPQRSAESLLGHLRVDDTAGAVMIRPGQGEV